MEEAVSGISARCAQQRNPGSSSVDWCASSTWGGPVGGAGEQHKCPLRDPDQLADTLNCFAASHQGGVTDVAFILGLGSGLQRRRAKMLKRQEDCSSQTCQQVAPHFFS